MESETNPYASPSSPVSESATPPYPALPIVFKASPISYLIAFPFGVLLQLTTMFTAFAAITSGESRTILFSILIAVVAGIGSVGCFGIFWVRVTVTEDLIDKKDLNPRLFLFEDIESWDSEPRSNSITIILQGGSLVNLHNWAMTRKNCKIMEAVLRTKVGPPGGQE